MIRHAGVKRVLLASMLVAHSVHAEKDSDIRAFSIDWTQSETLIALGYTPAAIAQGSDYDAWVKVPLVPEGVPDIGLRTQPNLERIQEINPDKILISPMFTSLKPNLEKIAPVTTIGLYKNGQVDWDAMVSMTYKIAAEIDRKEQADALVEKAEQHFSELKDTLPDDVPPLLMIQFMDANHVRVFGENSLYKMALDQLGLENAWKEKTNNWGFGLVGIDRLMSLQAKIVIVEPLPPGTEKHLKESQYWQYLVKQSGYRSITVPATWSFGAIPSAMRFASVVSEALVEEGVQ